jgi:Methyltransferase domain
MNILMKQAYKIMGMDKDGARPKSRARRMQDMLRLLKLPPRARIVELGGTEANWKLIDHDFHITLVNLPGGNPPVSDPKVFESLEGDACDLKGMFADNSFDVAFSNSVIEHVGPEDRQAQFASEVRRLAPAYWVQTPSPLFPLEAHTRIPFYWQRSPKSRQAILDRWAQRVPVWTEMLRDTRVLSAKRMQELFPDGQLYQEKVFGIEKSNAMYKPYPAG